MKSMRIALLLAVVMSTLNAADTYKPTIPMTNPETDQGYLLDLSNEMKTQIIMIVANAQTLKEAVFEIRELARVNNEFYILINDWKVTRGLVNTLRAKFGGYHGAIAKALGTKGAEKYVAFNTEFISLLQNFDIIEQVKEWVNVGADVNFSTASLCPLAAVIQYNKKPVDIVKYLISEGAQINYINGAGNSLFADAISRAQPKLSIVGAVQQGQVSAPITHIDNKLFNVEIATCLVEELLAAARKREVLHTLLNQIQSALNVAVSCDAVAIVSLLLQAGANPLVQDRFRTTTLDMARAKVRFEPDNKQAAEVLELLEKFSAQKKQ